MSLFVSTDELDHISSLERAAHVALCLGGDLQSASDSISALTTGKLAATVNGGEGELAKSSKLPSLRSALPDDSERAEFYLKLAPRIRRLESDTTLCLCQRLEHTLTSMQEDGKGSDSTTLESTLLILGHCFRGLALLGRGSEAESIFARVAVMPLLRQHVSRGRLDQGGARAECAGLPSLLSTIAEVISLKFGAVLRLTEGMFDIMQPHDIDLLTAGVWVPIATAFVADAGIQMAVFSPGIADILQANYLAFDKFLASLASSMLQSPNGKGSSVDGFLCLQPSLSDDHITEAQNRIYSHPKTAEFSKKWSLPIYYQLRFGECCKRLNLAIEKTKLEGWSTDVFINEAVVAQDIKEQQGFELALFLELYDTLLGLWKPDVILAPLTNRFLRGSVQLVGRTVQFIQDGMTGSIQFGVDPKLSAASERTEDLGDETNEQQTPSLPVRNSYCWGENEDEVAAVAWEVAILESTLRHQYCDVIVAAITPAGGVPTDVKSIISSVMGEAADQIFPVVEKAWNEVIVNILTAKCSAPLGAVKGVAATYRMTNRPPPTQASPFVTTILRPLTRFAGDFETRTPQKIGLQWKQSVVVTVADRYAAAVDELLATVARTEVALQRQNARNKRAARLAAAAAGGMSDGEKVKLQLFLDYQSFVASVEEAGINPNTVLGLAKLHELTKEGSTLQAT